MQRLLQNRNRYLLGAVIVAWILGGLVPFLNIDLRVIILTPVRWVSALASVYCLAVWVNRIRKKQAGKVLKKNKIEWLTFAFLVIWAVIGLAWMVLGESNALMPTEVVSILVLCMLAFCVFTLTESKKDLHLALQLVVTCGIALALLGCIEVVVGSFVPGTRYYFTLEERIAMGRTLYAPTTVFYNPNDFAAFLLLCLAADGFLLVRTNTKKGFALYLAAGVLLTVPALLATSTLFNLGAGALSCLTAAALLLKKKGSAKSRVLKSVLVLALALSFLLVLSDAAKNAARGLNKAYFEKKIHQAQQVEPTPQEPPVETAPVIPDATEPVDVTEPTDVTEPPAATEAPEIPGTSQKPASSELENSLSLSEQVAAAKWGYGTIHIRWYLIRGGWGLFIEEPLLGYGPGGFQQQMREHPELLEHTNGIVDPHCFFTELAAQYGVVPFALFAAITLWILLASLVLAVKELRKGCAERGVCCLMLLSMFYVVAVMPSSMTRQTPLWIGFILAVSAFSKLRNATKE